MLLTPSEVYLLALNATRKVQWKWVIPDPLLFSRWLVGLAFQESCTRKNAKDFRCMDTEADAATSTALGLTQVLKGTQRAIEKLMGWPERPLDDRKKPEYAMELAAAYMGYFLSGKASVPKGNIRAALVAYHDGHYSAKGAGQKYANLIEGHMKKFNWPAINLLASIGTSGYSDKIASYIASPEFR